MEHRNHRVDDELILPHRANRADGIFGNDKSGAGLSFTNSSSDHTRSVTVAAMADYQRESSESPILNAFCRVAPSVRFRDLAIFPAGVFFRASDFNSRTCSVVQARFFVPFFIRI
jgi:hypothetical protein